MHQRISWFDAPPTGSTRSRNSRARRSSPILRLTGSAVVDALVAAATEAAALRAGQRSPAWTSDPQRFLGHFWYPGPPSLFAWVLAHAPAPFKIRGVLIEADSLASV
jgi:hypothetical protein